MEKTKAASYLANPITRTEQDFLLKLALIRLEHANSEIVKMTNHINFIKSLPIRDD